MPKTKPRAQKKQPPKGPVLSVAVPCYNEEGNVPHIVARFAEILKNRTDVEVILVNDGSKDGTERAIVREIAKRKGLNFRIVSYTPNGGYGYALQQGLKAAHGDMLSWTHADMQTDPADVLIALKKYQTEANHGPLIIKGKRRNRRWLEALFTFGMQVISSVALGTWLDDINAQPKLFPRVFYDAFMKNKTNIPTDFSLDLFLLYTAKTNGYRISTIPVDFANRLHGESKGGGTWKGRVKLIKRTWAYIMKLRTTMHSLHV